MHRMIRPFLALGLSLLLVWTSGAMTAARSAPDATGQIVICTGLGITTISVDAKGNEVGARHICPDCVLTLADTATAPTPKPLSTIIRKFRATPLCRQWLDVSDGVTPPVRGPPELI